MNVGNGDGVGVWSRSTALHCVINLLEESGAEGNKKVEDVVSCVGYYPSRSRYTDVCSCWECCWHCQHVLFLKTLREFYEGNWKSISSLSGFFFFFVAVHTWFTCIEEKGDALRLNTNIKQFFPFVKSSRIKKANL